MGQKVTSEPLGLIGRGLFFSERISGIWAARRPRFSDLKLFRQSFSVLSQLQIGVGYFEPYLFLGGIGRSRRPQAPSHS
jgi:hypothetical protein